MFENAEKAADKHVAAALEMDHLKYRERRDERVAKRLANHYSTMIRPPMKKKKKTPSLQ